MAIHVKGQLPNAHFHKDWQRRIRCWFDQPGRKLRRRQSRQKKAAAIAPKPVDKLRPSVRPPTSKYNYKLRSGRGFTLAELKAAGISRKVAPTIGICVDHRRINRSQESLDRNIERLKAYKAKLIVLPSKKNPTSRSAVREQMNTVDIARKVSAVLPASAKVNKEIETYAITEEDRKKDNFHALRMARSNARLLGMREKRAREAAEEEANKK